MTISWVITLTENDDTKVKKAFDDFKDAEGEAIKMISARVPNIADTIDGVLSRGHTKKATALIQAIKEYFCHFPVEDPHGIAVLFEDYTSSYYVIKENGFLGKRDGTCLCFKFGDDLLLESNVWETYSDPNVFKYFYDVYRDSHYYIYFYVKTKSGEFKITMQESDFVNLDDKPASSANILLIYEVLSSTPKTRKEIQEEVFEISGIHISEATISDHIQNLKFVGVPIKQKRSNEYTRKYKSEGVPGYEDVDDGFCIDDRLSVTPDYSKCKSSTYPLLLLFLFEKNSPAPFSSLENLVDEFKRQYGIHTRRQTISGYINILMKFGYDIRHDKNGYYLVKH